MASGRVRVIFYTSACSAHSSLLTDTSYATRFSHSVSLTFFVYSLLWTRPQIRILVPTPNPDAYLAFLPQAMHGI